MWTFEREEIMKYPFVLRADTQANKNRLRKHTLNIIGYGGNGESSRAAQGILQNLKRRTFVMVFVKLLPRILPPETLQSANVLIVDENKEQRDGGKAARGIGVFNLSLVIIFCCFHFLNQKLKDPDHFGAAHVQPKVFKRMLSTL